MHCSLLVFILRFFRALYTTIMGRKSKQKSKNDAETENDPQEVVKDKSTQQYVFHDENQVRWHKSVQDLPPGQIIDIPYLKQLAVCDIVPIAYCKNINIDIVNNVPVGAAMENFEINKFHRNTFLMS